MKQQDLAVASGYWPLFRYNPGDAAYAGEEPFRLDSPRPTVPFKDYAYNELRYQALARTVPRRLRHCLRRHRPTLTRNTGSMKGSRTSAAG